MDKLTLVVLAAQQPRRAVLYTAYTPGGRVGTTVDVECAECSLRLTEDIGGEVPESFHFSCTTLATPECETRQCMNCNAPLEFE